MKMANYPIDGLYKYEDEFDNKLYHVLANRDVVVADIIQNQGEFKVILRLNEYINKLPYKMDSLLKEFKKLIKGYGIKDIKNISIFSVIDVREKTDLPLWY